MDTSYLNWFALGLCLIASFLLSGMEAGVFALNRLRIRRLARTGQPSAQMLNRFLERPEKFLWTILVGNTLANFLILGWILAKLHEWFLGQPVLTVALFAVIVFFRSGEIPVDNSRRQHTGELSHPRLDSGQAARVVPRPAGFDRGVVRRDRVFLLHVFRSAAEDAVPRAPEHAVPVVGARVPPREFSVESACADRRGGVADDPALDGRAGVQRAIVRQPRGNARGDARVGPGVDGR